MIYQNWVFSYCFSIAERGERNLFWLVICLAYRSAVLEGLKKDIANMKSNGKGVEGL